MDLQLVIFLTAGAGLYAYALYRFHAINTIKRSVRNMRTGWDA